MASLFSGRPKSAFWIFVKRHFSATFSSILIVCYYLILKFTLSVFDDVLFQFIYFLLVVCVILSVPHVRSFKKVLKLSPSYIYSTRSFYLQKKMKLILLAAVADILLAASILYVVLENPL